MTEPNDDSGKRSDLSWQRWLLQKELQARIDRQNEYVNRSVEINKAKEKIREKHYQSKRANDAYKNWIEEKNALVIKQQAVQRRKLGRLEAEKTKENELKKIKARLSFQKWKSKKDEEELEKERQEEVAKRLQAEIAAKKKEEGKKAFEQWSESIKTRSRDPFCSYVFSSGKLLGYYDWGRNPRPSFCNSQEWHPPDDV